MNRNEMDGILEKIREVYEFWNIQLDFSLIYKSTACKG